MCFMKHYLGEVGDEIGSFTSVFIWGNCWKHGHLTGDTKKVISLY